MEYRILGPLEVRSRAGPVELRGVKPRGVLAMLLLHANQPVSADRLAAGLWGEEAPTGAIKTVQVHVSRLRKALDDPSIVQTSTAGYCILVRPGELDAERFDALVAEGRAALESETPAEAARILREALKLWRGPPLADLATEPFAAAEITRLEEQRMAALEARIDADLAVGWHAPLVAELQLLVAAHPTRERLAGQLMLALYGLGRQADALEVFRAAREFLVTELGVEPGPELRRTHESVLRQAPKMIPASPGGSVRSKPVAAPATPKRVRRAGADSSGRTRILLATAALAVIVSVSLAMARENTLQSANSLASDTRYRESVARTCRAMDAATRAGLTDHEDLRRVLRRSRSVLSQRNAVLLMARRSIARGGRNLASLRALVPPTEEAHIQRAGERAWDRNLDRLRNYAARLEGVATREDLLSAIGYLREARPAFDRDSVTLAASLERLGRPQCRVRRVAVAPLTLPQPASKPARAARAKRQRVTPPPAPDPSLPQRTPQGPGAATPGAEPSLAAPPSPPTNGAAPDVALPQATPQGTGR